MHATESLWTPPIGRQRLASNQVDEGQSNLHHDKDSE